MKVVQINSVCGVGSTGKICKEISVCLTDNGIDNRILYCSENSDYEYSIKCADKKYIRYQAIKSRLLGNYGFNSISSTQKMIAELEMFNPDIVHLHNIHGHDCNLKMLFEYFKTKKIKVVWTFHDCWAFTAYCPHFTIAKCDKWKSGCERCPQRRDHSFFFDRSRYLYQKKKTLFCAVDLTVVTPSAWLASYVRKSFLGGCPIEIINNGIDLKTFRPIESCIKDKYSIPIDKKMLLGVAFDWGYRKGLDRFVELAAKLDSSEYQIVLVGTDYMTEKMLPRDIISINRTQNQQELAQLYTAADVVINASREENYPTVNMEALACGTPVITYDVGGSKEIIDDTCGRVIDSIPTLIDTIEYFCSEKYSFSEECLKRACSFNKDDRYAEYIDLYRRVYDRGTRN